MYYPGSNFEYHNKSCTFTEVYSPDVEFKSRVSLAYKYMTHEKNPANLVMLYFEQPDDAAHKFGPKSEKVSKK